MRFKLFFAFALSLAFPLAVFPAAGLPGNAAPLTLDGDLADRMVDGIHAYLDAETAAAPEKRKQYWQYDFSSPEAYEKSIAPNRARFKRIIGADLPLAEKIELEAVGEGMQDGLIARMDGFSIWRVRWSVLEGVEAEGIALKPDSAPVGGLVAICDFGVDQLDVVSPIYGGNHGPPGVLQRLSKAADEAQQTSSAKSENKIEYGPDLPNLQDFARNGLFVLMPVLIDVTDDGAGNAEIGKSTNQPQREFVYRMSYELGEHLIGYETLKTLAAAKWLRQEIVGTSARVGVWGTGEGGLIALCAGAVDSTISAVGVSGYLGDRADLWQEPIYHNVWGLLKEFGDEGIASLIAPRPLVVESLHVQTINGPPEPGGARHGAAPGRRDGDPKLDSIRRTFDSIQSIYAKLGSTNGTVLLEQPEYSTNPPPAPNMIAAMFKALMGEARPFADGKLEVLSKMDPKSSQPFRSFKQLVDFAQREMRLSPRVRDKFWEKEMATLKDHPTPEQWEKTVEEKRRYFHEEIIGKLPGPTIPPNPRMRVAYDTPKYTGYETVLDVWPGVIACGILLVPKDLKPDERRPVVVCQHGLEGRPKDTIEDNNPYYSQFAAKLAEEGFITYAPQNPYIFGDKFRSIQRKANPLGLSLFSFIVGQHQQTLNWFETLPFVDAKRIAFYGLSYGGKTAMRVPAIEKRYCLSICSGDFNDWITKNCTVDSPYSYMFTGEYEMPEWNLGRTFNYAEMARLIAPRSFMVERGHFDGVAPDEWVAAEYAKVKFLYDQLGLGDRTELEYFNGPHKINGVGTFAFLHKWLDWPKK